MQGSLRAYHVVASVRRVSTLQCSSCLVCHAGRGNQLCQRRIVGVAKTLREGQQAASTCWLNSSGGRGSKYRASVHSAETKGSKPHHDSSLDCICKPCGSPQVIDLNVGTIKYAIGHSVSFWGQTSLKLVSSANVDWYPGWQLQHLVSCVVYIYLRPMKAQTDR